MAKVEIDLPDLPTKGSTKKPPKKSGTRPKAQQIAKGKQKKPSLGKRVAESFVAEDVENVKSFVIFDVVVPTIKETILDLISMAFYGDGYSSRGRRGGHRGGYYSNERTNYNASYRSDRERERDRSYKRRSCDVPEIWFDTREDAREVLEGLMDYIDEYDYVSVADFNDMSGATSEITDEKWGWFELTNCRIKRGNGGYFIDLPKPKPLD